MEQLDWRTEVPHINNEGLFLMGELVVANSEAPVQQSLVSKIAEHASGRILEFGYGLGFSFDAIQNSSDFTEHWVIEGNHHIAAQCLLANVETAKPATVIGDTWEHAAQWLPEGYFDAILFDPYPFDAEAGFLQSWVEKFQYVAHKAMPLLGRILTDRGNIGFINFDPTHCTPEIVADCFGNVFEPKTARSDAASLDSIEEVWGF